MNKELNDACIAARKALTLAGENLRSAAPGPDYRAAMAALTVADAAYGEACRKLRIAYASK